MKNFQILSRSVFLTGLTFLVALLCAFTPGAHRYQIFLDSQLVTEQYAGSKMEIPKLRLDPTDHHRQLIVKYSECGRTVTGRAITLKDQNDKVLKVWHFEGATSGFEGSMTCEMSAILGLRQKGSNLLRLSYSSHDFPAGQVIAELEIGPVAAASNQ